MGYNGFSQGELNAFNCYLLHPPSYKSSHFLKEMGFFPSWSRQVSLNVDHQLYSMLIKIKSMEFKLEVMGF